MWLCPDFTHEGISYLNESEEPLLRWDLLPHNQWHKLQKFPQGASLILCTKFNPAPRLRFIAKIWCFWVKVEGFGWNWRGKNIFHFRPFLSDFLLKILVFLAFFDYIALKNHSFHPPWPHFDNMWPPWPQLTIHDLNWPTMASYFLFSGFLSNVLLNILVFLAL